MSPLFSHDKGTQYTLETTTAEQIQDLLSFYRLQRWGFVIYRCTYGNDDAWASFMRHLNQKTKQLVLTDTYDSPTLAGSLDWNVQEDQSLDGASKDEVRRRFKQWVASGARVEFPSDLDADKTRFLPIENPRYNYCIHVDRASLNSVVKHASQPDQPDLKKRGWVNLIRADESWDYPDFDRFDWAARAREMESEEEDPFDEGEEEVEGSKLSDVGWMKVCVDGLIPDVYAALTSPHMWDNMYCRPPNEIMKR